MSLSKNELKQINKLRQKKYRQEKQLFIAEGIKVVEELLLSQLVLQHLYCTDAAMYTNVSTKTIITEATLQKISALKTPNKVLAIFKMPIPKALVNKGLVLALDTINDPGNLGTIIRLCDWFGIEHILCTKDTVDCYNAKVVQATMGSLVRVSIHYMEFFDTYLEETDTPIYIATMEGTTVYESTLPENAILVMGNEANGIRSEIKKIATHFISIPRFGKYQATESLNVATATAILLNEFRRNA